MRYAAPKAKATIIVRKATTISGSTVLGLDCGWGKVRHQRTEKDTIGSGANPTIATRAPTRARAGGSSRNARTKRDPTKMISMIAVVVSRGPPGHQPPP